MKTYNITIKTVTFLSLVLLAFIFQHCTDKEILEKNTIVSTLDAYPQIIPFTNLEGESEIKVTTIDKEWDYSLPDGTDWLKAEREHDVIKLKAEANDGEKRHLEITITSSSATKKVLVVQDAVILEESILINAPDFSKSRIYEVTVRGKKVGELCLEFLNKSNEDEVVNEAIVFYGVSIGANIDYTSGYVVNTAGTVKWNKDDYEYTSGGEVDLKHFYIMEDGSYVTEGTSNQVDSETQPSLLIDKRGTEVKEYGITKVGSLQWITRNLATSKYVDGTDIPTGFNQKDWSLQSGPACAVFNCDDANNSENPNFYLREIMGVIYNAYAVSQPNIAPEGWRVATEDDWKITVNYLGGPGVAAGHLKETGIDYWGKQSLAGETDSNVNVGATNYSGITLRPGGYRHSKNLAKGYHSMGGYAYMFTNTINSGIVGIYCSASDVSLGYMEEPLSEGCPIRLVKE